MRRSIAVLVLALAVVAPASASHVASGCSSAQTVGLNSQGLLPVSGEYVCNWTVTCPVSSPHACVWKLTVAASGIGAIAANLYWGGPNAVHCTGVNSCSAFKLGYSLAPGQSYGMRCQHLSEPITVNLSFSCTATLS